jgi:hypothetical protein
MLHAMANNREFNLFKLCEATFNPKNESISYMLLI